MTNRYRLYLRQGGTYYAHDESTGKQVSLKTKDKATAQQLIAAKNAAVQQPLLNLALAWTYLAAHDKEMITRTWERVMDEFSRHGRESTTQRSARAFVGHQFDPIRSKPLLETTADDFLKVMVKGQSSVIHYLRRIHNLAINLGWLPWPVLNPAAWPKVQSKKMRTITQHEYEQIIAAEHNAERRRYYELLWETGSAQADAALLTAENIDWKTMALIYQRKKLQTDSVPCFLKIGTKLNTILSALPKTGPLFPTISRSDSKARSAEFRRRCRILKIKGMTLHSFRYVWAERAFKQGYPERFAQAALGHSSKAVHRAYSRGAKVLCPSLEEFAETHSPQVIEFPRENSAKTASA